MVGGEFSFWCVLVFDKSYLADSGGLDNFYGVGEWCFHCFHLRRLQAGRWLASFQICAIFCSFNHFDNYNQSNFSAQNSRLQHLPPHLHHRIRRYLRTLKLHR